MSEKIDKNIEVILRKVAGGELDLITALAELGAAESVKKIDDSVRLDMTRQQRCGFPEFVFGEGKTPEHLIGIIRGLRERNMTVLVTRINPNAVDVLKKEFPDLVYDETARTMTWISETNRQERGKTLIVTAGTTDLPVAREALRTLEACGCGGELIADAGVAGIHRLMMESHRLTSADVVIVVAGMEGALPSVVGGMVPCPVIAVPTSVGYGAALGGFSALLSMLNSCANGVAVMNIDNGFGAGCAAARIIHTKMG